MFFVHPAVAWMSPAAKKTAYFRNFMHISGMIAPVFMFLAGLSIAVIAKRAHDSGKDVADAKRRILKRGAQILLLGYGLHLFMYFISGASGTFFRALKVDILHCIGLTMMLIPLIAWPSRRRTVNYTALGLAVALPFLSMLLYRLPVGDTLPSFIAGYLTSKANHSLFPIIPYAAWIMFGLFFGQLFLKSIASKHENRFWLFVLGAAILMWTAGKGIKHLYYAFSLNTWGVDEPQIKGVPHYFWMKGAVVLLLLLASRLTAPLFSRVKPVFWVEFGRFSLFAYCVHLLIIYPLAGSLFYNRLSPTAHFIASALLTVLMVILLTVWKYVKKQNMREYLFRLQKLKKAR